MKSDFVPFGRVWGVPAEAHMWAKLQALADVARLATQELMD